MISAVCWIPPGKAKSVPEKYTPTEAELEAIKGSKKKGKGEEDEEVMEDNTTDNKNDVAKLYGFDNYDDDDADDMAGVEGDPMVQIESDDEEDLDDVIIRPTDSLLLAIEASTSDENDLSHLDIYIYEEHNSNLYVHHDVFLSSFPLCVAWQDYLPRAGTATAPVNLAAVGSFDPAIQIWDLDVLDPVYPLAVLGGTERIGKTKKRRFLEGSHTDAVMGIDWNVNKRNLLASSSADKTVKIWDLETCACVQTYTQHTDKVESVQWNPQEGSIVVCGSYDKTVTIMDVRSSSSDTALRWSVPADVESIRWNPLSPQHFFVSCENGSVMLYDAMKGGNSAPVWTLDAHSKTTSAISINPAVPIFATGSMDKTVKIWSYAGNKPTLLHEQNAGQHVFSLSFYNYNAPYLLAAGGDKSTLRVLNTLNYEQVAPVFGREVVVPKEDQEDDISMEQDDKPKGKANKKNNKK